ncbi:ABC transporter permease subunit [Tumebacillus permanentifrigoris]|uniref:ABC-2 family transporter n=1 Tax=Tumebacillus permanentifrigoris TaxID=378543 RepID=A0A316DC57_9BACL|nr:ABC transporter permease subunit [Tumebacillus permanentifrigoris]PWK13813.1 ABC-2 family transporter [Tumebacillus permanentifrigoris]
MNKTAIWAIACKDIRSMTSNKQIWVSMIILPLLFGLLFPAGAVLFGKNIDLSSPKSTKLLNSFTSNMPEQLQAMMSMNPPLTANEQLIYFFLNYTCPSLFLLIPLITTTMIAANSMVGEKERRTMESLLFAPISVIDLFLGKVLSALVPALAISFGTFLGFTVLMDGLTYNIFHELIFPNANWLILMFWVIPTLTLCVILFNVLISARVKTFQAAQNLSGVIVLPIVALMVSNSTGLLLFGPIPLLVLGAVLLVIGLLFLTRIAKWNQRHVLFEKQIH